MHTPKKNAWHVDVIFIFNKLYAHRFVENAKNYADRMCNKARSRWRTVRSFRLAGQHQRGFMRSVSIFHFNVRHTRARIMRFIDVAQLIYCRFLSSVNRVLNRCGVPIHLAAVSGHFFCRRCRGRGDAVAALPHIYFHETRTITISRENGWARKRRNPVTLIFSPPCIACAVPATG